MGLQGLFLPGLLLLGSSGSPSGFFLAGQPLFQTAWVEPNPLVDSAADLPLRSFDKFIGSWL